MSFTDTRQARVGVATRPCRHTARHGIRSTAWRYRIRSATLESTTMAYKFDPLRRHWRHYPPVVYAVLAVAESTTYRSHPIVGHEASKARGRMVRLQMTVRAWAKAKDAPDTPTPNLALLNGIVGWRVAQETTGEPNRVKHAQALEPVWCLDGYNKQSDLIYATMKGNVGEDWSDLLETVLPPRAES